MNGEDSLLYAIESAWLSAIFFFFYYLERKNKKQILMYLLIFAGVYIVVDAYLQINYNLTTFIIDSVYEALSLLSLSLWYKKYPKTIAALIIFLYALSNMIKSLL
ncbi:hypothetical protein L1765_12315 [Microaerobacter geothermalis]|uniref:hypothetical protein n=1 Tax=Microaerobacter geothermalis TaxID=674972 RepID=UPI001F246160|nr:hypothetical protein [Microaerobacter geothermalis]MCF6094745.1 hypothetical protein [Microaerobacter geothermalis]